MLIRVLMAHQDVVMGVSTLRDLTTVLVQVDMSLVVMREIVMVSECKTCDVHRLYLHNIRS